MLLPCNVPSLQVNKGSESYNSANPGWQTIWNISFSSSGRTVPISLLPMICPKPWFGVSGNGHRQTLSLTKCRTTTTKLNHFEAIVTIEIDYRSETFKGRRLNGHWIVRSSWSWQSDTSDIRDELVNFSVGMDSRFYMITWLPFDLIWLATPKITWLDTFFGIQSLTGGANATKWARANLHILG